MESLFDSPFRTWEPLEALRRILAISDMPIHRGVISFRRTRYGKRVFLLNLGGGLRSAFSLAAQLLSAHKAGMINPPEKTTFEAIQIQMATEWYVRVTLPTREKAYLGGFKSKAESVEWIEGKSADWLKVYERGRFS